MKFTYERVDYEFVDSDTWTTLEAAQLQEISGKRPIELIADFLEFGPKGIHALAWMTLRRAGVEVAWDQLQLPYFAAYEAAIKSGIEVVQVPPDPSPASTRTRSKKAGGRAAARTSRSAKS